MDIKSLQNRARKARDSAAQEKHQLFLTAWKGCQGAAEDQVYARIQTAREQLEKRSLDAADQGKSEMVLLRLPLTPVDLRHVVQAQLHQSQARDPDPYPQLRMQGPPSFREIERWLRDDLKLPELENRPPLDWLVQLKAWTEKQSWLARKLSGTPKMPPALTALFQECRQKKLSPRFESYQQFEESGVALHIRWKV